MTSYRWAIETFDLRKEYGEKVAVEGLSLQVAPGEVFGFLGPNGAGKTTSVKMMLGLVHPTSGSGALLGVPIERHTARRQVGFLPEHFRFHEWLRADEFLDLHGQLCGMSRAELSARIPPMLERVGLTEADHKRLSTYSKGMLQRIGLAMALLARPAIAFLDEPTSGLDPFGRRLVRDVIRKARAEGTTIFLNSHFLSEVEITCDRVAFIRQGRVIRAGAIPELTDGLVRITLRVGQVTPALVADLNRWGSNIQPASEQEVSLQVDSQERIPELTAWLVAQGVRVYGLTPHQISLEELFVQIVGDGGDGARGNEA